FIGYGFHFSGDVKPGWFGWDKDYITWQFEWGNGIGRYVAGNSTEFSLITNYPIFAPGAAGGVSTLALSKAVGARTTVSWGGQASYQHRWTPTLRSNVGAGILHHDITNIGFGSAFGAVCPTKTAALAGAGNCGLNKELLAAEVNLI